MNIWDVYSQSPYNDIPYNSQTYDDYQLTTIIDDRKSLKTGRVAADSFYKAEYDSQVKRYTFVLNMIVPASFKLTSQSPLRSMHVMESRTFLVKKISTWYPSRLFPKVHLLPFFMNRPLVTHLIAPQVVKENSSLPSLFITMETAYSVKRKESNKL